MLSLLRRLAPALLLLANPARSADVTVWIGGGAPPDRMAIEIDGEPVPTPPPGDPAEAWEVVVYVDSDVSSQGSIRRATDLLLDQVDNLVGCGSVELVRADPDPRTSVPATGESEPLATGLYELLFRAQSRNRLRRGRYAFAEIMAPGPQEAGDGLDGELRLLRERQDALLDWLAERGPGSRPRLLLVVSDVLGLDPSEYYLEGQPPTLVPPPVATAEVAAVAAAFGWVVAPVAPPPAGEDRRVDFARDPELPFGVKIRLGGERDEEQAEEPPSDAEIGLEEPPVAGLEELATSTGGAVIDSSDALETLLVEIGRRRPFVLSLPPEARDASWELRVTDRRRDEPLAAPRRLATGPPVALAGVRVRRLLQELAADGELEVSCFVERPDEEGRTTILVTAPDAVGDLRVTTGLRLQDGSTTLHTAGATAAGDGEPWTWTEPIRLPADTEVVVAVVEALDQGSWGGAFARFVSRLPTDEPTASPLVPSGGRRLVRLLPVTVDGRRLEIAAEAGPGVERVEFRLDGEAVAEADDPPFAATARLPWRSESHVVEAVAFGADGEELDRDLLVLDPPDDSFWVRIVEPRPSEVVGPVDVEATVRVPEGREVERVDFYWNESFVASDRRSPFRQRLLIPYAEATGYIRAEAHLDDGRATDDVVLMNGTGFGTAVEVDIVELLVVVTEDGMPVRDLGRDDFRVFDSGVEQELLDATIAGDLPLTVGLAIDTSLSLFLRLPEVQAAARSFVDSLLPGRDRAFLVAFGDEPRVVVPTTRRLGRVASALAELEPMGRTPVWQGIELSLLQLEEVRGRRALVVFYDGDDEDEESHHRRAVAQARRLGIPVYLVVMNNAAAESGGKAFRVRSFSRRLDELAEAGGGRVFFVRSDDDLTEVFDLIHRELRSHFRLTYHPSVESEDSARPWREIEVKMRRRGLDARTVSGYDPDRAP